MLFCRSILSVMIIPQNGSEVLKGASVRYPLSFNYPSYQYARWKLYIFLKKLACTLVSILCIVFSYPVCTYIYLQTTAAVSFQDYCGWYLFVFSIFCQQGAILLLCRVCRHWPQIFVKIAPDLISLRFPLCLVVFFFEREFRSTIILPHVCPMQTFHTSASESYQDLERVQN